LLKTSAGCFKRCFGDVDNFRVFFPKDASPDDKAVIMCSAIMLDYMYFEENPRHRRQ